jgi:hypothetical protein
MPFFFRKSFGFGPVRINLAKSGVGASVGVKGARLTTTPRGTTYVTVGSHGFYYRETLSTHKRNQNGAPPQAGAPRTETRPSDEIVTADVSDLVDSSSETLIQRLNERARMLNPAWILYVIAVATLLGALTMFSASADFHLPQLDGEQTRNTVDEYSTLVIHYGYPSSILASDPVALVPVRTAHYVSAQVKVVFVPNGCVGAYEKSTRTPAEVSTGPALAKHDGEMRCVPSSNGGWTIVRYIDSADNETISADIAELRMDRIAIKETAPPIVNVESLPVPKQKSHSRGLPKKQPQSKPQVQSTEVSWAMQDQIKRNAEASETRALYSKSVLLLASLGLFIVGIVVHKKNTENRTSRLFYELDETEQKKYGTVQEALAHLEQSYRTWRIEAKSATPDWKRNAGASNLVRRVPISVGPSNPPHVETNLAVPCINIGSAKLFFLPDVILYLERGTYGGIAYDDFRVEQHITRFIEDEQVPTDATIVDRTWRYVNKNGGPDRRFNNNVQLPVVQYGALLLISSQGLNIQLNTSNVQESLAFANCWRKLHNATGKTEDRQSTIHNKPEPAPSLTEQAFKMLGLNASAPPEEISAAYHRLAQMYHPDKVAGLAPEFQTLADQRMKEINAAYELLSRKPTAV